MQNTTLEKVRQILVENMEIAGGADIKLEDSLSSLDINSISFVKLIVAIETTFNIEFDDEQLDYKKFVTIEDLVSYINNQIETE